MPDLGLLEPLAANVYFQQFAYYVALQKDRPIDKPRNLAKSVTVNYPNGQRGPCSVGPNGRDGS